MPVPGPPQYSAPSLVQTNQRRVLQRPGVWLPAPPCWGPTSDPRGPGLLQRLHGHPLQRRRGVLVWSRGQQLGPRQTGGEILLRL